MTQQSYPGSPSPQPEQPGQQLGGPASGDQQAPAPTPAYGSPAPAPQSWGSPYDAPAAGYGSAAPAPEGHQIPTSSPGFAPVADSAGGRSRDVGFFAAMFDFGFQHFVTVKFSSFLYVLAWVVAVLVWGLNILFGIIWGFVLAGGGMYYDGPSFTPWPLIIGIVLGWIPSVIAIVAMRLGLEFSVATIRTAQNTEDLVSLQKGSR